MVVDVSALTTDFYELTMMQGYYLNGENPDVVLMDLQFGSHSRATGVDATRRIRALDAPPYVLVLTNYDSDADILGAVEAGADAAWYPDLDSLLPALPGYVKPGDLVLVKASHSMSFDRVVKALCALGETL